MRRTWIRLPRFAKEAELAIVVDKIARRYGMSPADVIDMSSWEMTICLICITHADKAKADKVQAARNSAGNKSLLPFPVPVLDLGDL